MKTLQLDPDARDRAAVVAEEIERMLADGQHVAVSLAEEQELLSPSKRLIGSGFPAST
jgi:hypothetical protein